jgi:ABC-type multidrug transport system permease subunit
MERLFIFLKRQIKERVSYRMTLFLGIMSGFAGMLAYGFLGNSAVVSVTNQTYGMSLASYLVSGVAFSSIVTNGPGMFNQYASPSQIEEVMVTPTGFREYILLSSLLSILASVGSAVVYFTLSVLLFRLSFSYNIPILLAIVLLGLVSSIGLGFIGLGFQLVYKQTSIFSWLLYALTGVVGNMLVPVQILPAALQTISYLTPQYYFFTGIRVALGSDVVTTGSLLTLFSFYTVILMVAGLLVLARGLKFLRRNGTHRWT